MAASIHDIGKISLPAEILSKPVRLTEIERKMIQAHSRMGYEILKGIDFSCRLRRRFYSIMNAWTVPAIRMAWREKRS
jgi:HD-GYP domain-containing protein (c-di-GMP phosphodiesterase class II)